jgi:NADPH-dependent 2,4-dienoyl-CoA reductase/sulfur reductase-like enzyme
MNDAFKLQAYLDDRLPRTAVIIGAGYIGAEMADSLTRRGINVTMIEYLPTVLSTVDPNLSKLVQAELERHGVCVRTGIGVEAIEPEDAQYRLAGREGPIHSAEMVLVATGARPETSLTRSAGIELGPTGAIRVSRRMETNVTDVFAAGDCVETWHRVRNAYAYLPLGTTAHKQGRVAGENAVGGCVEYAGSLGTQVVKVFDLVVGRTGLRDDEALEVGFDPLTVEIEAWDHKVYYPNAHKLHLRMTGDVTSGRLLGAQMVGHRDSEVSKRIDVFAAGIYHGTSVEALNEVDLTYTPPLSSPWDPVQMAAQRWERVRKEALVRRSMETQNGTDCEIPYRGA